jgi:hypothetical protein
VRGAHAIRNVAMDAAEGAPGLCSSALCARCFSVA